MGFLQRVQSATFSTAARASTAGGADQRGWFVSDPSGFWLPGESYVSPDTAQTLSAVWQGVRLKSEGIASVPCHVFRRMKNGGKERAEPGTSLGRLQYRLRWQPNDWQTAFEFWELAESHVLLRGLFLAEIIPGPGGFADQLIPRHPDRVRVKRLPNGRIVYILTHERNAQPRTLTQEDVFVIRGRTTDGLTPMSFLAYGAQSIGASLAAQRMAASFFKKGTPAIAVLSKDELGAGGMQNLHNSIMTYVNGSDSSFGILPLEGDLTIEKLGLTPADSQLLPMLAGGVEDVARWLNIPLHMMRMNQAGTNSYASLEVFQTEFVTYGLRPDAIRIEQSIQRDLILAQETVFAEFLLDALLRGNLDQRSKFYQSAILTGYMNRNEVREKENMNPVEGLDRYLEPQNMAQLNDAGDRMSDGDRRERGQARVFTAAGRMRDAFRASMIANDLSQRILGRERAAVGKLATRHANDADGWAAGLRTFYEEHARFVSQTLRIDPETAREYAAKQGAALEAGGVAAMTHWDYEPAEQLAIWALQGSAAA